jgi:hypothetical protein
MPPFAGVCIQISLPIVSLALTASTVASTTTTTTSAAAAAAAATTAAATSRTAVTSRTFHFYAVK